MQVVDTSKSMTHDIDIPMCHWVDACNTTMYILNRCTHRILKDKALDVEKLVVERLVVIELLKDCLSLMSNLEQ
jgi:hypothetical protein